MTLASGGFGNAIISLLGGLRSLTVLSAGRFARSFVVVVRGPMAFLTFHLGIKSRSDHVQSVKLAMIEFQLAVTLCGAVTVSFFDSIANVCINRYPQVRHLKYLGSLYKLYQKGQNKNPRCLIA